MAESGSEQAPGSRLNRLLGRNTASGARLATGLDGYDLA